jgi:aspartyl-tRNA(Asn)/glutamyl-tRNA(Gln) amidotransferase subunit C
MSLTPAKVAQVAHLARLELTPTELETMTRQLRSIVAYVDQLREVNTDGVEPLAHPLPISNVFRDDELAPSLPVAEALANAPDRRTNARGEQFFAVPAVLDAGSSTDKHDT